MQAENPATQDRHCILGADQCIQHGKPRRKASPSSWRGAVRHPLDDVGLTAGLWRLRCWGAENYRLLAEQNRVRKEPVLAHAANSSIARNRLVVATTIGSPAFWFAAEPQRGQRPASDRARAGPDVEHLRATLPAIAPRTGYRHPHSSSTSRPTRSLYRGASQTSCRSSRPSTRTAALSNDGFAAHLIG